MAAFSSLPIRNLALAGAVGLIAGLAGIEASRPSATNALAPQADDGWRRTAQGWEPTVNVTAPADSAAFSTAPPSPPPRLAAAHREANRARFDTHPAALALLQSLAVLAAFYGLPREAAAGGNRFRAGWWSALTASFRASAFGS